MEKMPIHRLNCQFCNQSNDNDDNRTYYIIVDDHIIIDQYIIAYHYSNYSDNDKIIIISIIPWLGVS